MAEFAQATEMARYWQEAWPESVAAMPAAGRAGLSFTDPRVQNAFRNPFSADDDVGAVMSAVPAANATQKRKAGLLLLVLDGRRCPARES